MRLMVDTLIALMCVMLLAGVVWARRSGQEQELTSQRVRDALAALHAQTVYHGALGDTWLTDTGFPMEVSPLWFDGRMPFNLYASARRPWIDVAPPGDLSSDPPDPVFVEGSGQAGFWYNPALGLFRARVAPMATDAQTLALYNEVNQTALPELPRTVDMARQPIAHAPRPATSVFAEQPDTGPDRASPARRTLRAE